MKKPLILIVVVVCSIVVMAAYVQLAGFGIPWTGSNGSEEGPVFDDAYAFIEYNTESEDYGFHVELDGDEWKEVRIFGPSGEKLFAVSVTGNMVKQGLTSLSFESAELPTDELSLEAFLARFPEGDYRLEGVTLDGETMVSTMKVTHAIPAPPVIVSPRQDQTVPRDQVVVEWEPVTSPAGIEIDIYTVVFFPVDPPEGQDPIDLNIDLTMEVPGDVTQMTIPGDLLESGEEYVVEVYAKEIGGNQVYSVITFVTSE